MKEIDNLKERRFDMKLFRGLAVAAAFAALAISGTAAGQMIAADDPPGAFAPRPPKEDDSFVQTRLLFEAGGLAPLAHTIQFSKAGTKFDYVDEGGQDNVFFFWRPTAELTLDQAHTIVLLYQPLNIRSRVYLERDVVVDEAVFREGTGLDLRYGFDFYRVSYLYDFLGCDRGDELALGVSLQMRNATIDFTSTDGTLHRSNRDIGPVPAIKVRGRWLVGPRAWIGGEADAIYAPIKYINGSDTDVEGAFFDLSLRAGYLAARSLDLFVNLRYIGGGAEGTGDDNGPGDGYTSNWLHLLTFSLGMAWTPTDYSTPLNN
jgi:hypothetical protein